MKVTTWRIEDDILTLSYEHEGGSIYLRERNAMPGRPHVYEEIALDDESVENLLIALKELQRLRRIERDAATVANFREVAL